MSKRSAKEIDNHVHNLEGRIRSLENRVKRLREMIIDNESAVHCRQSCGTKEISLCPTCDDVRLIYGTGCDTCVNYWYVCKQPHSEYPCEYCNPNDNDESS
jgi:hypothetical protein